MVQLRNGNLHRGGKRPGGLGLSRLRLQIFAVLSNENDGQEESLILSKDLSPCFKEKEEMLHCG